MYCRNCGNQMDDQASICVKCGVQVGTGTRYCPNCGAETGSGAAVCTKCGYALTKGVAAGGEQKSKLVAGLLAIFLGTLGIHNFYLGNTTKGIIQIVVSLVGGLFTCGVATVGIEIWALVEGIMLLTGKIAVDGNGTPLKE